MKNKSAYQVFSAIAIALTVIITGCAPKYVRYPIGNERLLVKGNVRAFGRHTGVTMVDGTIKYTRLSIGTPKALYNGTPGFSVKLADGKVLGSSQVSETVIKSYAGKGFPPYRLGYDAWPKGAIEYQTDPGYDFIFLKGKLIGFRATIHRSEKNNHPVIGNAYGTGLYKLPLTRKDFESLFGKPEKSDIRYQGSL